MIDSEILRATPYVLQFLFEGQVFSAFYESTLTTGASESIQFKTNGSKIIHLLEYSLQSNSEDITLELIEAPTLTDGDSEISSFNYNRRSSKVSDAILYDNPTSITGGTNISKRRTFGLEQAGQKNSSSDAQDIFIERLLKENEDYIITITNNDDITINYIVNLIWYESGN